MGLEHPEIERTRRTGYPHPEKIYGVDEKGNAVMYGDEILALDHLFFLVSGLDKTEIQALEEMDAQYVIASD